ncbi:phospho-N-acetylmuramoyl-pentapeptide transferase [Candidatus Blochmanniella floridana]|uniref:Phospho-N-acetylmuramoyl-pentapeptide-transferase n=1 Tax=Blochmanniella floridana TaxID=203907 RepID=MRAY_BLOFL|nr:RecName: Full=Phospho-N-acetylmuramoyl-pentapeptide-transferase; AltName: Full=UDP-MurNAc-pentapeptide phosphotransferase [Candidatus Blochmannia floridanus]CAD83660.1 phospho-N-acetylmuramoyl-pentapeptide transferase [Candidatus Blochmannia floridanus]
MLFWIIKITSYFYSSTLFEVMNSVLFRGVGGLFFSLFISIVIGNRIIVWLKYKLRMLQTIRIDGPQSHKLKYGTPTMGGIIILISVVTSVIIWSDLSNIYIWYILFIFVMYGILGLVDDFLKIKRGDNLGLTILNKYLWQSIIAWILIVIMFINRVNYVENQSGLEFLRNIVCKLKIWDMILAYFVIVGTSNSVNLSDGLDGLVIVPVILVVSGLAIVTWVVGNIYITSDLYIEHVDCIKELVVVCASIIGAGLGFLWFNSYPSQIFMGDVGSLSLGGVIGLVSILLHQEYLLLIMGGIFVIESLSVIFQVSYFKIFKKRIFKMAPIHHHFELKGYMEPKIVVRFWIVSSILVLLSIVIFILSKY